MLSLTNAIYSQFLYWLALRFQVRHPVMYELGRENLYNPSDYTWWQRTRIEWNIRLMAASNNIIKADREGQLSELKSRCALRMLMGGVSHNPYRKDPESSVL